MPDVGALTTPDTSLYDRVRTTIKGPAAATRVADWHVRDLAPDVVRIGLTGLDRHDSAPLLRAMLQSARADYADYTSGGRSR